jgi:hypothetical protein
MDIEKTNEIKDKVAKKEGYKDWMDMIRCLYDPNIGHPGMYTLDDIINSLIRELTHK